MEKFGINYPIVMGDDEISAAFGGMDAIPTTFIVDRTGIIRDRKVGSEPTEDYEKRILAVLQKK
jgi:peroxiredoxin